VFGSRDVVPVSVNSPSVGWAFPDWRELWQYRSLLASFVARDLTVRYKQTILGAAWAVLQPALITLVFTVFFSLLGTVPEHGVPFALFIYAALMPWTYYGNTISKLGGDLLAQQGLITKVYFPRLLIPLSSLFVGLVDMAIACAVLIGLMALYHVYPTWTIVMAPAFVGLVALAAFGLGVWLSALNVEYRDVQLVLPFLIQLLFFAAPIIYPLSLVPRNMRTLYSLNPMVGVAEGFRWTLLPNQPAPGQAALLSLGVSLVIALTGMIYFRHVEDRFVDVV
jgi:lipopolysaccharide transport system permease protein